MAKLNLKDALEESLTAAKVYIDTELAKKANSSHGTHVTYGGNGSASTVSRSDHTHNYAGSSSAGGAANSVKTNLIVKLNGGSTEGTNLFTFNGSTAKTVNVTASGIGAAPTSHASTATTYGAASASNYGHAMASSTTPKANGTAAVGSETAKFARGDHVHPLQTTVSGNAGSATKLQTARNIVIGNKTNSFNGSANITYTLSDIGATETVAWDTSIKCATWSRLFQFASSNATTGGTFLVNIRGTRASVVYNPTLLVNFSHSSVCNIVQINNTSYSNIKVRGVVDSNGSGYFEIYDNINSATNSTTQTVSVTVTEISSGLTITKYTAFTDGSTIPTNYSSKGEITTVSGAYYSGTAAKASTATSASSATKATQDSAGQQINTTYIKGLSVSGKTITYTKGDGTTGTITTQDTNTTYTANTGIKLNGTTFQHTNAVTAGTAQGDASKTLSWGGTFTIPTVTYDAQGHVTGKGTTTMTMPGNPNTDTHHTAKNIVGASTTATANATSSNGSTYLNLIENGAVRSTHKISGTGATTVTSDSSGNITINSTNTTYGAATTSANGLMTSAMVTKLNGIAEGANKYTHPSYTAKSSGFYKVTVDASGHVSATAAVAKADIEALLTGAITSHTHSYAPSSHNHTSLTGITSLGFKTDSSDAASISTTIDGTNTYFDFNLSDDATQNDMWRWRFTPSGGTLFNAMTLDASSATDAKLTVTGNVTATSFTENGTALSSKYAAASHGTHLTLGTGSGNAYRGDYGNTAYNHSQAAHAPSNAQKNSDITKAEIEAKLTGTITSHAHNALASRGNVTCETGAAGRPAVTGLSMSQAYNNGYPTTYGNILNLRGTGDGQLLIGWPSSDGAHAPVYVRSKRDNTSTANWSGWAQVYTTAHKPTPADIGAATSSHGTHLTLGTGSGNAFRGDYGNTAYTHSQAAHAPSNAQKNSDITKAEIEAKLTGTITSHSHNVADLGITPIVFTTQANYDSITPNANTLYIIS